MDKKKIMNWVIAIIVAIVYLSISIIFDAWAYSWLIWVVYAIYRFIAKQTNYNLKWSWNTMANESKKDFNVMMNNNKDMPKIQIVEDEKIIKKIWWN